MFSSSLSLAESIRSEAGMALEAVVVLEAVEDTCPEVKAAVGIAAQLSASIV